MLRKLCLVFFLFVSANSILLLPFFCQLPAAYCQLPTANFKIDSLLTFLKKDKEDTNKVNHLNQLCREYLNLGKYDSSMRYGNAAFDLGKKIDYSKGVANSYNNIGAVYYNQGDYEKALENHLFSLKIREKIGDKKGIAASYNNIGIIHWKQDNYEKALKNYFTSLKIKKEIGNKLDIATSYNNIGLIYWEQGNYAKALENYLFSLKIGGETGNKRIITTSYNNIGIIYGEQGNHDKALETQFASLTIYEEISDKQGIATSYLNIGNTYMGKKNYAKAITYLLTSLQIFKEIEIKDGIMETYKGLSEANEKMNDYKKAHIYYQLYSRIKDSIFNEESSKQIIEMQTKYEVEKKDKAIEMQSFQLSKQQLQLRQNKILQLFLFVGILFIIIIVFLLYNSQKNKQRVLLKTNLLEQQKQHTKAIIETQEQERIRIARDLHDGIGQTLAGVIANYEELNAEINSFSEEKQKKFRHTAKSLDEAYKELRAISHLMMPRALKVAGLSAAISDLLEKTLANTSITYNMLKTDTKNISEGIAIGIYRIFQELLSNVLKHSQADNISVQLFNNQNQLILIVEDDGVGIPKNNPDLKNTGIGLMNITARAQAMQGTFIIEYGTIKGMVATVIVPVADNGLSIIRQ